MPCIPLKPRGFLCVGPDPVSVEHNGQTYLFEWTAASGWCAMNKDGSERLSRVPNVVWDKLVKQQEKADGQ